MDLGFLFDAPQLPELMVAETIPVPLIMVASEPGLTAEKALDRGYVMVDWGISFAISHARYFPDMATPRLRVGQGRMAKALLLARGGVAYLAEPMVRQQLMDKQLFRVSGAPVIERIAYGVYPLRGGRRDVIEKTLSYFSSTPL
jgi:DNA-binding transcriptional LysR family regulator